MVVTGSRLPSKINSTSVEMEIRTSEGIVLEKTASQKLLGVHIDQELSFNDHVDYMCAKSLHSEKDFLDL